MFGLAHVFFLSFVKRLKDEIAEVTNEIENLGSTEERFVSVSLSIHVSVCPRRELKIHTFTYRDYTLLNTLKHQFALYQQIRYSAKIYEYPVAQNSFVIKVGKKQRWTIKTVRTVQLALSRHKKMFLLTVWLYSQCLHGFSPGVQVSAQRHAN